MSLVTVSEQAPIQIDQGRILRALKLDPNDPNTQALLLVCQRYDLDPVLRHMVLISGNPYITRDGLLPSPALRRPVGVMTRFLTPRAVTATIVVVYGLTLIAGRWHTNRVCLAVAAVLLAGFVVVDGWQARRCVRRAAERAEVGRIVDRSQR